MPSLLVETISNYRFIAMRWKRLFIFNSPWITSKFFRYKSLTHSQPIIRQKQNFSGQLLKSLQGRASLLIEVGKNAIRKNLYLTLTLGFIGWMLFFDSADLIAQYKLTRRIKKLQQEKIYYLKQIEVVTKEREELMSSEELLEKFAREKYFMKKPTEEVYIIEE